MAYGEVIRVWPVVSTLGQAKSHDTGAAPANNESIPAIKSV